MKEGDVVSKIGGVNISAAEDVIDASFFLTAGDRVPITIQRDGQEMSIEVRPAKHPIADVIDSPRDGLSELHVLAPGPLPENLKLE